MGIHLSSTRYEEIKRKIVDLFVEYGVSCVPVSGFEIATKMGIGIIPYSTIVESKRKLAIKKSDDGFCVEKSKGEWFIVYNDSKPYGRINNTIMHEIGHIVLDHSEDSELAEKEVNFFAKYALAPPVLIYKLKLNNSNDIAKIFDISREAAGYAYSYYRKWLKYGGKYFADYEITMLNLFKEAM